jgi:hypothetical protein
VLVLQFDSLPAAHEEISKIKYTYPSTTDNVELPITEIVERNADDGVTWLHSNVSRDRLTGLTSTRRRALRRCAGAAGRTRLPIDLITEVSVLDQYPYDQASPR